MLMTWVYAEIGIMHIAQHKSKPRRAVDLHRAPYHHSNVEEVPRRHVYILRLSNEAQSISSDTLDSLVVRSAPQPFLKEPSTR